ncbi:hypothetical protein SAMN05428642_102298 [Flaviramulus basaltis]|uniref:Uncharacterized protein n=1 Tax=Flaviramulus basaltis TaxID=369401 RepID=A0A1K2IHA1_9FLAO|nr:hypothetical protein SAMN05428642_102298 [Flaviramulus basaltis]
MLTTITLTIFALVVINLLLLKFSCNKIIKPLKVNKNTVILRPEMNISETSEILLAATGS